MKRTRLGLLACLLAAVLALAVLHGARGITLVLTSGARVSGQLVDMNSSGFVVSVGSAERTIPAAEVAIVDFTGDARNLPANEVSRAAAGQTFAVLHGGRFVYGSLSDIGGTDPLRLTMDTPSGQRDLSSADVVRIYLAPVPGGAAAKPRPEAQPPGQPTQGAVTVSASRVWTPTGLYVNEGEPVRFRASGEVQLSGDSDDVAVPAGSQIGRRDERSPRPDFLAGALIGRVGNSEPFGIGNQTTALTMPASGQLFLGVNEGTPRDNRGAFQVEVLRVRRQ